MRREVIYKDLSPTAAQEAALSMPELQPFSSFSDVLGTDSSPRPRWQTGERNAIILNGKSTPFTTQGQRFGIWSLAQSDDNLDIAVPPLEITFSGLESSTAFTLVFDDPASTYCTELNLKYYRGSDLLYESDYFPDSPSGGGGGGGYGPNNCGAGGNSGQGDKTVASTGNAGQSGVIILYYLRWS